MSVGKKRVIFIEHDHVSAGGPIWAQFERRGYEITRFVIVDEENAKTPNVTPQWPDLLSFDVVVVMGAPFAAYDDERIGKVIATGKKDARRTQCWNPSTWYLLRWSVNVTRIRWHRFSLATRRVGLV